MYRKANEAKMILSTLPPWLKSIINARVAGATTTHARPPPSKSFGTFWNNVSTSMTPLGPMKGGEPSPPGWLKGK